MAVVRVTRSGFESVSTDASVPDATMAPAGPDITVTAASNLDESPSTVFGVGSMLFLVVSAAAVIVLDQAGVLRNPLKLSPDVNAFALIYVATQGIERLLEPLTYFIHSPSAEAKAAKDSKDEISTAATPDQAVAAAKQSANSAAMVNRKRSERAILFWCLASLIGIVVSAAFGLQFIGLLVDDASRSAIPKWFDVLATGLVIGGGTKILHGLIDRIAKPKDNEDA